MLCFAVTRKGRKSILYVSCDSAGSKMKLISVKEKQREKETNKRSLLRQEAETIKDSSLDTCPKIQKI